MVTESPPVPEWTERGQRTGLDPLGMQNSSVKLYQTLVPGISNVTQRMRYYGLYAWLSQVYAHTISDTDPRTWQRFLRRAEALYALVATIHGDKGGVAGAQWAARKVAERTAGRMSFAKDAEPGSPTHYLQQAWGAYGAAYGSQLFEIGILSSSERHDIPVPSPGLGEGLAEVFAHAAGDCGQRFIDALDRGSVGRNELELLVQMSPSEIRPKGRERRFYEDILFARSGPQREQDQQRRKTLLLLLRLAEGLDRSPDAWSLRWFAYSGFVDEQTRWPLDDALAPHALRWKVYHANDLSHVGFEALLKFVLDRLEAHPTGVSLQVLISAMVSDVMANLPLDVGTWQAFVDALELPGNAMREDRPNSELALSYGLTNAHGRGKIYSPADCANALRLIATLQKRTAEIKDCLATELGAPDGTGPRSIATELAFLTANAHLDLREMLSRLFEERVVQRHLWVAVRKLRYQGDYTFLIDADDGRVKLRRKDGPVWTNPRLDTSVRFLRDIHLLDDDGVTELGRAVLGGAA